MAALSPQISLILALGAYLAAETPPARHPTPQRPSPLRLRPPARPPQPARAAHLTSAASPRAPRSGGATIGVLIVLVFCVYECPGINQASADYQS